MGQGVRSWFGQKTIKRLRICIYVAVAPRIFFVAVSPLPVIYRTIFLEPQACFILPIPCHDSCGVRLSLQLPDPQTAKTGHSLRFFCHVHIKCGVAWFKIGLKISFSKP